MKTVVSGRGEGGRQQNTVSPTRYTVSGSDLGDNVEVHFTLLHHSPSILLYHSSDRFYQCSAIRTHAYMCMCQHTFLQVWVRHDFDAWCSTGGCLDCRLRWELGGGRR